MQANLHGEVPLGRRGDIVTESVSMDWIVWGLVLLAEQLPRKKPALDSMQHWHRRWYLPNMDCIVPQERLV